MKICQISTVHPINDIRVFHKECKSLVQYGYEVTLIINHNTNEIKEGVNIIGLKKRKGRLSRMLSTTIEALFYSFRERADIYHFHDPEFIPMGIILKLAGKKVIYDVHENTSQQMLYKDWLGCVVIRWLASGIVIICEGLSKKIFDAIVVARPDIAMKRNSPKVHVVKNAVFLSVIDNVPKLQFEVTKPVIIYAGGLTKIRGIKYLIKAMSIISNRAELWLLGDWESEKFRGECEELEGWKYVKYKGYKIVEQVYSYMKKSDIAVMTFLPGPNHLTTLPNKPFEYMACRLPVIMSNFPYWKRIFGNNAIYVNPESSEQIADEIIKLLDDVELRKNLGYKGRKLVEKKYSWEKEVTKLLNLYEHIVRYRE